MKAVEVSLRDGARRASLPDGRSLYSADATNANSNSHVIPWEDYVKISASARQSVVQVDTRYEIGTPVAVKGVSLTYSGVSEPTGVELGDVLEGYEYDDRFRLVRFVEAVSAGQVVTNNSAGNYYVGHASHATSDDTFAGVALAAQDADDYGFVQIHGLTLALEDTATADASDGDRVYLLPAGDGTVAIVSDYDAAETYADGDYVLFEGSVYEAAAATVAGDTPVENDNDDWVRVGGVSGDPATAVTLGDEFGVVTSVVDEADAVHIRPASGRVVPNQRKQLFHI